MLVTTFKKDYVAVNVIMITSIDLPQEISAIDFFESFKIIFERLLQICSEIVTTVWRLRNPGQLKNMFVNM